jgi:hypothetical protein
MTLQLTARAVSVPLILLLASLLLAGCAGSLTKANYDQIKPGMTEAEVRGILGKTGVMNYSRIGDDAELTCSQAGRSITVRFHGGRVVSKSQKGIE